MIPHMMAAAIAAGQASIFAAAGLLQSVDATGWSAQWAAGVPPTFAPDVTPKTVQVSRPGFDATGAATTYSDVLTITQRVRQPYPNQALLTASTVALSDYVYSTDTVPGALNNSPFASPVPIANWALVDRALVGTTLRLEVVAFHRDARNGKPVACVVFTVTDGTHTVTQTVAAPAVLGHPGDKNPVIGYGANVDISTLTDGQITANAKVYPWIGTAASIADSSGGTANSRNFCPQVYTKNTSRFAAPYVAYLSTTGNDGTGAVSTNSTTAAAAPFATLNNLIVAARAAMPGNRIDGLRVRFKDGFTGGLTGSVTFNTYQDNTEVVFEPDPAGTGTGVYTFGDTNSSMQFLYLRLKGMNVTRLGNFSINVLAAGKITMENCSFNNASSAFVWGSQGCYLLGATITNPAQIMNPGVPENRLVRGVTFGAANLAVEGWLVLGCNLSFIVFSRGTRTQSGGIIAFNKCLNIGGGSSVMGMGASEDVSGFAVVQNLFEWTSATGNPTAQLAADSGTGNFTHLVMHNNTLAGFFNNGRSNLLYNETTGQLRTHSLASFVGNIHAQINTKHDVFSGVNKGLGDASSRVGGWAYMYGVGCRGEFSQFIDAAVGGLGTAFAQAYPGLKANIGTSLSVRNDPKFVNYQAVTSGPTAGAGGGDYRITAATSPCVGQVVSSVLPYTLDGVARPAANDNIGALSAA